MQFFPSLMSRWKLVDTPVARARLHSGHMSSKDNIVFGRNDFLWSTMAVLSSVLTPLFWFLSSDRRNSSWLISTPVVVTPNNIQEYKFLRDFLYERQYNFTKI
jgi:hypothetical protein